MIDGGIRLATLLLAIAGLFTACAGQSPATALPSASEADTTASAAASWSAAVDPATACDGVDQEGPLLEIPLTAASFAFDVEIIEGPRQCQPFVIVFTNTDSPSGQGDAEHAKHDIDIRADGLLGPVLFDGELTGKGEVRYEVPGLPAGEHYFYCSNHAGGMNGTIKVESAG